MTAQAAPQAGTGDRGIDELTRDCKQVIGGQQQRLAQRHHDQLLCRRERGVHRDRIVGTVNRAVAILPLTNRLARDIVEPRQGGLRQRRGTDLFADQVGGTRLAMEGLCHEVAGWGVVDCIVRKAFLALKRGQLRMGT